MSLRIILAAFLVSASVLASPAQTVLLDKPSCDGSGIVDPHDGCSGDGIIEKPNPGGHGGFQFENPSENCKYVSQPYIYDNFMDFQTNFGRMFTLVHRDVDFTIVGYQPVAGHYDNVIRLFVNAIRRVSGCLTDHLDKFRVKMLGIHGACNSDWSVQEVQFLGVMNSGDPFDVVNVWVTRWHNGQIVEARVYTDSMRITELLRKNEIWMNSSTYSVHKDYIPGPLGMPNIKELEDQLGYPNGTKYESNAAQGMEL